METVKYNSKSLWANLYQNYYGKLPKSTCSYGWGSLLMLITLPLYLPGYLWIKLINRNNWMDLRNDIFVMIPIVVSLIGCFLFIATTVFVLGEKASHYNAFMMMIIGYLIGVGYTFLCLYVFYLFFKILSVIYNFISRISIKFKKKDKVKKIKKEKQPSQIKEMFMSMKDKHCKKIDWE